MNSSDCPFCRVASGLDTTIEVICGTREWVAFFPDAPATPGHTLVIPRAHVGHYWEAEPPLAADLGQAVLEVGQAILRELTPEGMNLITSAGAAAEQSVPHLHLHLVPRWHGDRIDPIWPSKQIGSRDRTRDLADRLRLACKRLGA